MKKTLVVVGITTAVIAAAVVLTVALRRDCSDATLIARFNAHRADFETLLEMTMADKQVRRIADGKVIYVSSPAAGLSPERIEHYEMLFGKLGILSLSCNNREAPTMSLRVRDKLFGVFGRSKGYGWSSKPPRSDGPLDDYKPPTKGSFNACRVIDDKWYIWIAYGM